MFSHTLIVTMTEDEDSDFSLSYLKEAIEQGGGFVVSVQTEDFEE